MKNLIVVAAVLLAVFVVIGLVYGWIEYRRSTDTTTIDIHTQEMKEDVEQAADKAVDAGKRLIGKTGDALKSAGEELSDGEDDLDRKPSDVSEPVESTATQP